MHFLTLPSEKLLRDYPNIAIYSPLADAIKAGNLALWDKHFEEIKDLAISNGTYLTLVSARIVVVRELLRRVSMILYDANNVESLATVDGKVTATSTKERVSDGLGAIAVRHRYWTRIPFSLFQTALNVSTGTNVGMENVECWLVNLIDGGYAKGYLSHEKQTAVLSSTDAFPILSLSAR